MSLNAIHPERIAAALAPLNETLQQCQAKIQQLVSEAFAVPAAVLQPPVPTTVVGRLVVEVDTSQIDAALAKIAALKLARAGLAIELAPGDRVDGGTFLGIVESAAGVREKVILLDGEAQDVSWDAATKWAKEQGGSLPTRAEQKLLFQHLRDQFKPDWYWSCEQHADYPTNAWYQGFDDGYQGNDRKSYAGRARLVRRLPI